jgi:dCMP deaminase
MAQITQALAADLQRIADSEYGWHEYFLNMIPAVAKKSKDRSTKVGSIIVGADHSVKTFGFNGFPRGVNDDVDSRHERPAKYLWTEHSERNALYNCLRNGTSTMGCCIYVDWTPCADCARGIIQAGIKQVVIDGDSPSYNNAVLNERWKAEHEVAVTMMSEAGVKVLVFHRK